ncbi:ABC transporter ATP-binding protein [Merdibacter massiliensis]|uniref:ABC transporter ATP-binding protein n=1 Tax=Merdibacter massiliensis TaxID=1871030 RepID=UPI00096A47A4|nr:ABC transporter ATP-binding protein [Merdibacter massiliensis]
MKLELQGIAKSFSDKQILSQISIQVKKEEFISILGPSGCGKSTILNILTGILAPDEGNILVDGKQIQDPGEHFAYMPQEDLLLPWKTILDNVCLYGILHKDKKHAREKALKLFPEFGLQGYEKAYPDELSGGMRQRAAFLRTALSNADILLLDEPFAALDVITRNEMQDWLSAMKNQLHKTAVLVTHDIDEAIYLSDRVLILNGHPATIQKEIAIKEKERTREWLYAQSELRTQIHQYLKENGSL